MRQVCRNFSFPIKRQLWQLGNDELVSDDKSTLRSHGIDQDNRHIYLYLSANDSFTTAGTTAAAGGGADVTAKTSPSSNNSPEDEQEEDYKSASEELISIMNGRLNLIDFSGVDDEKEDNEDDYGEIVVMKGQPVDMHQALLDIEDQQPVRVKGATAAEKPKISEYDRILAMDSNFPLVPNSQPFSCKVCFEQVSIGKGAMLHQCLHPFCR